MRSPEKNLIPNYPLYKFGTIVLRPLLHVMGGYHSTNTEAFEALEGNAALIGSSHTAGIDPVLIGESVFLQTKRPMHYLAKSEIWEKTPRLGKLLHELGAVRVERNTGTGLQGEARQRAHEIMTGKGLLLSFVQGTREVTDKARMKTSIAYLAMEYGKPIVPAGVSGTEDFMGLPREVVFGTPIYVPKTDYEVGSNAYQTGKDALMGELGDQIIACEMQAKEYLEQR